MRPPFDNPTAEERATLAWFEARVAGFHSTIYLLELRFTSPVAKIAVAYSADPTQYSLPAIVAIAGKPRGGGQGYAVSTT